MKGKKHILVFIYNSFKDPLFQGLLFKYINIIAEKTDKFHFHILTFEQKAFLVSKSEQISIKNELQKKSISWYPQNFHTGKFLLLKKAIDLLQALGSVTVIHFKYKPKAILAFANIAGSFSYLLSKIFRWKLLVFSYEPHSQFLEELGFWSKHSLKYKLLSSLEKKLGINGDHIITGTKHMIHQLEEWKSTAQTYRLPTSVDHNAFNYSESSRNKIREELNIKDKKIVIYTGKFGDLYYKEEIFQLCQSLYEHDSNYFFMFLTGHEPKELAQLFSEVHIPISAYFVGRVQFEEVTNYLSAADIGLVTVANFPSKKYCSPTKVGEYLCCGLPYIVTIGTSEDDEYAKANKVGVVVDSFSSMDVTQKIPEIEGLLNENRDNLRERCRKTGIEYRGLQNAISTLESVFFELV